MTHDDTPSAQPLRVIRRVIVGVIVVSFGLAALVGIIVLLGGSLGSEQFRVLGTTATIGAFSVAVLCCAALVGRRLQVFGFVGVAVAVLSAVGVVWLIWFRGEYDDVVEAFTRLTWTGIALTVAFSFASLLLLLADREQRAVRIGLVVTLVFFAVVLGMTIYTIWWSETIEGDTFGRTLGVFAILAALGAVIVPVLSLLLRAPRGAAAASGDWRGRIESEAARRGVSADALVDELLRGTAASAPGSVPAHPPVDPQ